MKNFWKFAGCLLVLLGAYLPVAAQSTKFTNITYEHNVTRDGKRGMVVHFCLQVDDAKGHTLEASIDLSLKNDFIKNYINPQHQWDTRSKYFKMAQRLSSTHESSTWKDLSFFVPYEELCIPNNFSGEHELSVVISVEDLTLDKSLRGTCDICYVILPTTPNKPCPCCKNGRVVTGKKQCYLCSGTGRILHTKYVPFVGVVPTYDPCTWCQGTGYTVVEEICEVCRGTQYYKTPWLTSDTPRQNSSTSSSSTSSGSSSVASSSGSSRQTDYVALGMSYYEKQDYANALNYWRIAAEQGDAAAQYNLGQCYYSGEGVTRDYAEAVKWYRKAAEQGHASAQYNLGVCYENAKGVTRNYAEAVKWYRKAAEQGYASAQYNLGLCYYNGYGSRDYAEAVKWYRKAAEQGHASAQNNLGVCYENAKGVTRNYAEAVKWYRKAAEQGYAKAQYNLGGCYYKGEGVLQDYTEAVKWWRKAAEQGYAKAQYDLGLCYDKGEGVPQNYAEAVKWYRKAAAQGDEKAKKVLEIVF